MWLSSGFKVLVAQETRAIREMTRMIETNAFLLVFMSKIVLSSGRKIKYVLFFG